jgi:hypothetical protein
MPDERYQRLEERVEYLTRQSSDLLEKCEASEGLLQSILQVISVFSRALALYSASWMLNVGGEFPLPKVALIRFDAFWGGGVGCRCFFAFNHQYLALGRPRTMIDCLAV